jgi:myo-inositol-1(or 4)-monophosphatase
MTNIFPNSLQTHELVDLLALATQAMQSATETLRPIFQEGTSILSQDGRDIKLAADQAAHQVICDSLSSSGLPVFSEESSAKLPNLAALHDILWWLIDPLDGSANFNRGFPIWGSAIALLQGTTPVLGVIYNGATADLYQGIATVGSVCNGIPITVTTTDTLSQAILTTGFPTGRNYSPDSLQQSIARIRAFKKIRMIGSATISLCTVAAGIFDAYYEEDIWLWDVAAGLALIQGAGGQVQTTPPKADLKLTVAAWNRHLPLNLISV